MSYYRESPEHLYARLAILETVNGIEIKYDPNSSKFMAMIGGRLVQRTAIQPLRKIASTTNLESPVPGFKVNESWPERFYNSPLLTIVSAEGGRMRTKAGTLLRANERVFHYDEMVIAELTRIYEEKMAADKAFTDQWRAAIGKLRLITLTEVKHRGAISAPAAEDPDLR
jgi:hypothetical protein